MLLQCSNPITNDLGRLMMQYLERMITNLIPKNTEAVKIILRQQTFDSHTDQRQNLGWVTAARRFVSKESIIFEYIEPILNQI